MRRRFALWYASTFAILAVALGAVVTWKSIGDGWDYLYLYAGAGGFVSTFLLSYFIVDYKKRKSWKDVIWTGATTGLLSHYLCWYFMVIGYFLCNTFTGECKNSLGEGTIGPIAGLFTALNLSFFSLLFFGWVTIFGGILIGLLLKPFFRLKVTEDPSLNELEQLANKQSKASKKTAKTITTTKKTTTTTKKAAPVTKTIKTTTEQTTKPLERPVIKPITTTTPKASAETVSKPATTTTQKASAETVSKPEITVIPKASAPNIEPKEPESYG